MAKKKTTTSTGSETQNSKIQRTAELEETLDSSQLAAERLEESLKNLNEGTEEFIQLTNRLQDVRLKEVETEISLAKLRGKSKEDIDGLRRKYLDLARQIDSAAVSQKNLNSSVQLGRDASNKLASSVGITDNTFSKFYDTVKKNGFNVKSFTKGIQENISYQKIAGAVMEKVVNVSKEYGKTTFDAGRAAKKAFGVEAGKEITDTALKAAQNIKKSGVGYGQFIEETFEATQALTSQFSVFNDLSAEQQSGLAKNAYLMGKLGVSSNDYADSIQMQTAAMGLSAKESAENMREMISFANKIKRPIKSVNEDFKSMKSYLSQFGPNFEKVFYRMEAVVKKTGLAISDLQGIAEGFDTFEGAGESVGKLNALLGGPFLNTIEMINTEDPAERILNLKKAFDAAGKSVGSMSRRELQAFAANIPGINNDTEKLKKLFGNLDSGVLDTADSINQFLESTDQTTDSLEKQVAASMTFQEIGDAMKSQFAAPLEDLHSIAESLAYMQQTAIGFGDKMKYIFMTPVRMANNLLGFFKKTGGFLDNMITKVKGFFSFLPDWLTGGEGKVAAEVAEEAGQKVAGKSVGAVAKASAKAAKAIPVLGALPSLFFAGTRYMEGDYVGAGLELASAGANLGNLVAPGAGSAASLGIDAAILARDMGAVDKLQSAMNGPKMAAGGIVTKPVTNATVGEAGREAVIPLENGASHLVEPLTLALKQAMGTGGGTPNITLKVELGGRELTAFVKQVMVDTLNPFA